jgi:hypothetical protein
MGKGNVCKACRTPREISKQILWENNGAIVWRRIPGQRTLFYEVDGINALFDNLGKLMGQSMNRIICESKRKNCLEYLESYLSGIRGLLARSIGRRQVYQAVADLGAVFGYGHFEIGDIKAGEYAKTYAEDVYSIPLITGDLLGTFNAVEHLPAKVTVEEERGGFNITISRGDEPEWELSSRLEPAHVPLKPGSIKYDRCKSCGAPIELAKMNFDLKKGTITDKTTGRRLAVVGIDQVDAALKEIEDELGKDISSAIIQAKRDYAKSALTQDELAEGHSCIQRFFALRGLGNLVGYELEDDRLEATVDNARPPLIVVGLLLGMFELLTGRKGDVDYSLKDDGTLLASVKAI